jgi:DNA-binding NarL/FixJ family response regulator
MRCLLEAFASQPQPRRPGPEQLRELTGREREVVALVAKGLNNEEIAQHLVISKATVKTHVNRAMFKLQARHRAELVVLAYETGLVLPGRSRDSVSRIADDQRLALATSDA